MKTPSRTSLTDQAMQSILREIRLGRWQVGGRLPNEAVLCEKLSVSRGTLREAVRALVAQGVLETRQGSGTYVLSASDPISSLDRMRRTSLRDRFETRAALEIEAVRLACLRHRPETILALRQLLAARGDFDGRDVEGFVARDFAFHAAVVAASDNRAMIETYEFFSSSIRESIAATLTDDVPEPDLQAHMAIVDAIESRDPDRATESVRRFMAPVLQEIERLLAS